LLNSPADPFAEQNGGKSAPVSEFLRRRGRFPDSLSQVPAGARKPYSLFGDAQESVDLWFFRFVSHPDPLSVFHG